MLRILPLLLLLGLGGCISSESISLAKQYEGLPTKIAMPEDTYRVFEHPSAQKVMTTPSINRSINAGIARGLTFGLADGVPPEQQHQAAAEKYLAQTGRAACVITSGYILVEPQYEFTFECPEQSSADDGVANTSAQLGVADSE